MQNVRTLVVLQGYSKVVALQCFSTRACDAGNAQGHKVIQVWIFDYNSLAIASSFLLD